MRSSPGWPSGSALPTRSPKAARRANGSNSSTSRPAGRWPSAASTRRISPNSGKTANWSLPTEPWDGGPVRAFRRDPEAAPLPTPSGKIEITSQTIAGFGYAGLPGAPDMAAAGGRRDSPAAPLSAAAGRQPAGDAAAQPARFRRHQPRLEGRRARAGAHPSADAAARGIRDGDIVRLYNDRGACLAGAVLSEALRPGVVQLSTGAWYDPDGPGGRNAVLRARQSQRADPRRRHVAPGAGLHRPARR